jgi:hypothetical protein
MLTLSVVAPMIVLRTNVVMGHLVQMAVGRVFLVIAYNVRLAGMGFVMLESTVLVVEIAVMLGWIVVLMLIVETQIGTSVIWVMGADVVASVIRSNVMIMEPVKMIREKR